MALSLRGTSGALHKHNLRSQRVQFGGGVGKSLRNLLPGWGGEAGHDPGMRPAIIWAL